MSPEDVGEGDVINITLDPRTSENMIVTGVSREEYHTKITCVDSTGAKHVICYMPPELETRKVRVISRR